MAEEGKKGGLDAPEQPQDVREANLKGVASNTSTASGLAARDLREGPPEPPKEQGSTVEIAGGPPKSDYPKHTAPTPTGAQAQPATFVSNGTVPANFAASPSGFVAAGGLGNSAEESQKLQEEQISTPQRQGNMGDDGPRKLSSKEIDTLDANTLRAAAHDRGYDLGPLRGSRGTRAAFRSAQDKAGKEGGGTGGDSSKETGSTPPVRETPVGGEKPAGAPTQPSSAGTASPGTTSPVSTSPAGAAGTTATNAPPTSTGTTSPGSGDRK